MFRQRPVPFAPNISEGQPTVVFSDQAKADQVRHVAREQMLRLRNTKADSAHGDFLMQTEWCFKATLHGLPQAHVRWKAWAQIGGESPLCPHSDCCLSPVTSRRLERSCGRA